METLIVLVILIVIGVIGFQMFGRARSSPEGKRAEGIWRAGQPSNDIGPPPREPTVETLRAGDAVSFWDGEDAVVDCVLECEESVDGAAPVRWRWVLMRGGRVLELAPDANILYTRHEVAPVESPLYQRLTDEPADGGILKTFEARVRQHTTRSNPVTFEYDGQTFQVRSTGTVRAVPDGAMPTGEVWRELASDSRPPVYFEMDAPEGVHLLGVWMTNVLLLVGEPLKASDIRGLYAGQGRV